MPDHASRSCDPECILVHADLKTMDTSHFEVNTNQWFWNRIKSSDESCSSYMWMYRTCFKTLKKITDFGYKKISHIRSYLMGN